MKQLNELLLEKTELNQEAATHLSRLASDWQLIADLSFADLALWVESKQGTKIAIAQVRAATAATVFPGDFVGEERSEIPTGAGIEIFPVRFKNAEIAKLSVHRNPEVTRSTGQLESSYQEIALQIGRAHV